ncbi:hypothetical protein HDA44_003218 [Kribbella solani]|uniref:Uncharacterized protein n=1 Tax=Kribbella solani TaxID=236067 RepID=A0A841DUB7_9ACTN|nr:hypothetical protein [Kribbella solani]
MRIAPQFAADRRGRSAQPRRDRPYPQAGPAPVSDHDPLVLAQEPRRGPGHRHPACRQPRPHHTTFRPSVAPHTTSAFVHTHQPRGFLIAIPLVHEPEVFRPLTNQLLPTLRHPAASANPEIHRTPQTEVLRRPLEPKRDPGGLRQVAPGFVSCVRADGHQQFSEHVVPGICSCCGPKHEPQHRSVSERSIERHPSRPCWRWLARIGKAASWELKSAGEETTAAQERASS